MKYASINIQGNILSQEVLDQLDQDRMAGQNSTDFGFDKNVKLRDEIARTWADVSDYWRIFKRKSETLKEGSKGTTETRNLWIIPFLDSLGYKLVFSQPVTINDFSYDITHRASNLDQFPVIVVSFTDSLDRKPEGSTRMRMSPHATMQEYLNLTEHTYGLVTNGKMIRLLRDSGRISRLSYLEFNLEQMLDEDIYSDFTVLYRLLHSSRMPQQQTLADESIIEKYHQNSLEEGSRVRKLLSKNVKSCIKVFANGFLKHPDNERMREIIRSGELSGPQFYHYSLRLIYRFLFLMVIEDRRLVFPETKEESIKRLTGIYYRYYSISRARQLVDKKHVVNTDKDDLWISVRQTFRIFEDQQLASRLGIMALNGELFDNSALGPIKNCSLSNQDLLEALSHLSYFINPDSGIRARINYERLNVEEFGSIYEGLLEINGKFVTDHNSVEFTFAGGSERSTSGSHYSPEELVQPLIKHSLDYVIEEKKQKALAGKSKNPMQAQVDALLSIRVCDVTCGSGHILLSAARRIALEVARLRSGEDQPNPTDYRKAIRDVIRHCIYGVDKNPLAVELCKISLWLESHNPGETLSFLDHHIKCGDAIVGLAHRDELENGIASEAFKALPGDDKDIAKIYRDQNNRERKERETNTIQIKADLDKTTEGSVRETMAEYTVFTALPETTPEEISSKAAAYRKFLDGKGYTFLKSMADTQIAQFFIPKTEANKGKLMTDGEFRNILEGHGGWQNQKTAMAIVVAQEKKIFHWFIEFPEIFQQGGFDCILGNPPFLGGLRISKNFGNTYLVVIQYLFLRCKGTCDLVAYFFRRDFQIININGFVSLISTNTISQGDTREGGLDVIISEGAKINFAIKSQTWPGKASVEVSLIAFSRKTHIKCFIGSKSVSQINSFFDDEIKSIPFTLNINQNKSFKGVTPLGSGFVLEPVEAIQLLNNDDNNKVIKKYLIGDDLNNNYDQSPSRYIIHFGDMTLEEVSRYKECFFIVKERVKPEREKNTYSKSAKEKWWLFERSRPDLYNHLKDKKFALVSCTITKYLSFTFLSKDLIFDVGTNIITEDSFLIYSIYHSTVHEAWARKYGSSMKNDLRYTPSDCFETFPFPQDLKTDLEQKLEQIGIAYHEHRRQLMLKIQLGLTKTYNAFHAKEIQTSINTASLKGLDKKAIDKQYGKEVWNLWNHLQKTEGVCSIEEAIAGILKLRELHVQMDNAVLEAYGWQDIALRHDFYEVDYLPENDRVRFTIHPDARREILKRLLELNHKIHEEEVKAGLWDKKKPKPKKQKDDSDPSAGLFGYGGLFDQEEEKGE